MIYDASSIQIKHAHEFDYHQIEAMVAKYARSIDFIRRGFESCRLAGVDPDYFISKYLKKDPLPEIPEVTEINKSLQTEAYRKA